MPVLHHLKQSSYSTQWLILGIALLTLGGATAFSLYLERDRTERREQDRLLAQSRVIQENIEQNLASVNKVLADLRRELPQHRPNLGERLKTLTDALPGIRTLVVLDSDGTALASNRPELSGENFAYRDYFKIPRQNPDPDRLFVSSPIKTSLGIYGINVARTIPGPKREFAGIIVATLDPDYFKTLLASVLYAPDMWTAIAHGDGIQFLMVPEREGQPGKNLDQPGSFFARHRDSGKDVSVLTGVVYATGEERMMAMRSIRPPRLKQDKPLVVAVGRDLHAIFEPWRHDARVQSGLFVVIAFLATGGLYLRQRGQREFDRQAATAAAVLERTAERLQLATEAAGVGVWDYDLVSGRLTWDDSMFAILGVDKAGFSFAYADWQRTVLAADLPAAEAALRAAIDAGRPMDTQFRIRRGDGQVRDIRARARVHRDAAGKAVRMVGTNEDITERQRLENALRSAREDLTDIANSVPVAVYRYRLEPDGTPNLLFISERVKELWGISAAEAMRDPAAMFAHIHPDDQAAFFAADRAAATSGSVFSHEYRVVLPDGDVRWLYAFSTPKPLADGRVVYNGFVEDITAQKQHQQALLDSERFMRILTDNIPGMVGYWTAELRCGFANKNYLEWFGKTPEQMSGIRIQDLMGEELFRKNEPYIHAALRGERQQFERTLTKADGSIGHTWAQYIPDLDGGQVKGFFVLVSDVTEIKQAEISLAESEWTLRTIIETEPECVKVLAPDGTLKQMNRAGLDMIEADSEDQVVGHMVTEIVAPQHREAFTALNERVNRGESGTLEFEIIGLKGGHRWLDTHAVPMRDANGQITGLLGVTRDITQRKKVEQALEQLAQTDFLTNLANRRHFLALAEQELSRTARYGGPLSVLMIDLDHFKNINDTYGHKTGDVVLQRMAEVTRDTLRDVDVVGRLGGEEFAVVLPQTDRERALEVAERLRQTIADAVVPLEQGLPLRFTVSIGVTTLAGTSTNIDTLLSQADEALYQAKNAGRNRVCAYNGPTIGRREA